MPSVSAICRFVHRKRLNRVSNFKRQPDLKAGSTSDRSGAERDEACSVRSAALGATSASWTCNKEPMLGDTVSWNHLNLQAICRPYAICNVERGVGNVEHVGDSLFLNFSRRGQEQYRETSSHVQGAKLHRRQASCIPGILESCRLCCVHDRHHLVLLLDGALVSHRSDWCGWTEHDVM